MESTTPASFDASSVHDLAALQAISDDLGRLDTILGDAIDRLMQSFATIQMHAGARQAPEISEAAMQACVALQFQDMATQLIAHCRRRLTDVHHATTEPFSATHFPSTQIRGAHAGGPVAQSSVGAGSIDLF
ncbi:hypothetical protein [Derxia gummosa]|uniref:Uncharacterized protein n=1 Tax=Derxia gummosa DSM 723 TaxID=1121388 RepID=A0A8B6XAF1_9BURK|nr:hypothetical protein [Derxia gummosa]